MSGLGKQCLRGLVKHHYRELRNIPILYEEGKKSISFDEFSKRSFTLFGILPNKSHTAYTILNRVLVPEQLYELGHRHSTVKQVITGCMAHELEHVVVYQSFSLKNIFIRGNEGRAWVENELDRRVIQRGLGEELYAMKEFHRTYMPRVTANGLTAEQILAELP